MKIKNISPKLLKNREIKEYSLENALFLTNLNNSKEITSDLTIFN